MSTSKLSKMGELLKANKIQSYHGGTVERHYLNTGYPPLNKIISGDHNKGLPSGQLVMIAGPSACGKTMISTQLMISAQKYNGFAGFFDYEGQYQRELAVKQGLDIEDDMKFFYDKPDTFEEGIGKSIKLGRLIRENKLIPDDAPIVFVFDSIHAMTPESKYDNIMGKEGAINKEKRTSMHDNYALSKACSDWFRTISQQYDKLGITGVFINQVREEKDSYGNISYKFPGGDTHYFYCSTVLVLTAKDHTMGVGDDKILVKKDIKCLTEKSRNTMPKQNVHWDFRFNDDGTGDFDVITSYTNYLLDIGAIKTKGAWIEFMGKTIQGRDKVINYFKEAEDGVEQLIAIHDEFMKPKPATEPE